jgi:hypothetical protein
VEAIAWATVLIHHAPFLWPGRQREGAREAVTNLLADGGRRRRKREEVWARPEARWPEEEGLKEAPWEGGVGSRRREREENGRRPKGAVGGRDWEEAGALIS